MPNQNNIQDELKALNSSLPANNNQASFAVPEGYFDGLAAQILAKAKSQSSSASAELEGLSPLLASLPKQMPYGLPTGYFEQNLSALPPFLSEDSPVLDTIGKAMPYSVSQGYFENLPQQILAKLPQPKAKVVSLFARKWMRVAAAAVVGGVIFASGYQYLRNSGDVRTAMNQSADTVKNWVANNGSSASPDIKKVSTKDLEEFIKEMPVAQPATEGQKASQVVKKAEVKRLLKGVSKKDIDNFLEQMPAVDDDLTSID